MRWEEWLPWLVPALSALLGGGGVWALLGARAAGRATERAAEAAAHATERAAQAAANATERAAEAAAIPQVQTAVTADWAALMSYWQSELAALRAASANLEVRVLFLEHQREEDLQHIEVLELHIWNQLPPPPPTRKRIHLKTDDPAP